MRSILWPVLVIAAGALAGAAWGAGSGGVTPGAAFYVDGCGFRPTAAGVLRLRG